MKRHLLMYVALLSIALVTGCNKTDHSNDQFSYSFEKVDVTGITIQSTNNIRTIKVEETLQLVAVVYPQGASQEITWTSSDNEKAIVDENGLVNALSAGLVNIIATSVDNTSIKQSFSLVIEEKDAVAYQPESIVLTANDNVTTCKAGESITLTAKVLPDKASQSVLWESSDETIATVKRGVVTALKEGEVVITAKAKDFENIKQSITLKIEPSDDPIYTNNWNDMDFSSHTLFMDSEDETPLKVKGVVTHVTPIKEGRISYYLQEGINGYYIYNQNASLYPVELGKSCAVGGYKKYYRGANEIVDVEYFNEWTEPLAYTVNDLTGKDPSSTEDMSMYHASYVSTKATILSIPTIGSKAYSVSVSINQHDCTLRIDPSMMTSDEFTLISSSFSQAIVGQEIEFKGIMSAFGYGAPSNQIQIVKSTDLKFAQISASDLVAAAAEKLAIVSTLSLSDLSITLPSSIEEYADVSISWSSDNPMINVQSGAVTHNVEDTIVNLTATLSYDGETQTKVYKVNVLGNKTYEVVQSLNLDDAAAANNYGNSTTKPSYAEGIVSLGTPTANWMLRNALIASTSGDRYDGIFSIRAKSASTHEQTGRIEIQQDGEYNYVQFDAAVYGNDSAGIQIGVEYSLDSGATWIDSSMVVSVLSTNLEMFRIALPKGVKRVAIYVVENSGNRVNIDNIQLMK